MANDDEVRDDQHDEPGGSEQEDEEQQASGSSDEESGEESGTGDEEDGKGKDGKDRKPSRRSAKIARLIDEKAEATRQRDEERRLRLEAEAKLAKRGDPDDPKPRRQDFDDPDEFDEAKDAWLIREGKRQALAEKGGGDDQEREQQRMTADQVARRDRVQNAAEIGRERYKDYDEVVFGDQNLPFTESMVDVVSRLEERSSADVSYYLGNHPKVCEKLSKLSGTALALEVGQIAQGLRSGAIKPGKPPKRPSGAPEPIETVGGGDSRERNLSNIQDIDTWMERRNAEVAARQR